MKKQLVIIALLASFVTTATAQNCDICEKVLVQDFLQVNYSESISLHYLNTINSENYRKKETQSILSGAFPIEGVPVGGSVDYSDFSEYRSRLFSQKSFNFTKDQSLSVIKTEFSSNTLSAFNECMSACQSSIGVFAYIFDISEDEISIAYSYKSLPGSKEKLKIDKFDKTNLMFLSSTDSVELSRKRKVVSPNDVKIVRFKRVNANKNSIVTIDFSLNRTKISKQININALPIIKKYKIIRLNMTDHGDNYKFTSAQIIRGAVEGDADYGQGTIFHHEPSKNQHIIFGPWENSQCGKGANGWYITGIGSCSKGGGSLIKGLNWIEVIVEDK